MRIISLYKKPQAGFTLVELLIVIVVIAIVASISVVAYNGVQERANASKKASAITQYEKLLELYKVDHGVYPDADMDHDPGYDTNSACLGMAEHYPATEGFNAGMCMYDTDVGFENNMSSISTGLNTALSQYGSLPDPSGMIVRDGPLRKRGVVYSSSDGGAGYLLAWELKGRQDCGDKSYSNSYHSGFDVTFCLLDR